MPTLTKSLSDFSLKSEWSGTVISEGTASKTFNLSAIPKGSTVTAATLTGNVRSQFYGGRFRAIYNGSSKTLYTTTNSTAVAISENVLSWFSGMSTFGDFSVTFAFKESEVHFDVMQGYGYFTDIALTVTYTLPYTAVTAPDSISLSVKNPARGKTTKLSWSGAKAGTNNAITGYEVWRSTTTKTGTYTKIAATNASTRSYTITAPNTDVTYYYKVKTIGTVSGYDSGFSDIVTMAMSTTACTAPTSVTANISAPYPGQTVRISWSGASGGTNNAITGYQVFEAESSGGTYKKIADKSSSASYHDVTAPQSGSRYYKALTVGAYINSAQSTKIAGYEVDRSETSDFTVPETAEAGDAITVQITDHQDKAHTLAWQVGANGPGGTASIAADSTEYILDSSAWADSLTDATEYPIEYRLTTSGAGTIIKSGKITIPDNIVPTGVTGTVTPVSDSVPAAWGLYVSGQSQAEISVTGATPNRGAAIVSYSIKGPGVNVTGGSVPLTATSGTLYEGENTFIISATDTRGRTGSTALTVTVAPYAAPTLKNIMTLRCRMDGTEDEEGTWILCKAQPVFSSCGNNNSVTVAAAYRQQGTATWTSAGNLADVGSAQWELQAGGLVDVTYNWDIRYTITDALGNTATVYDIVTRSVWEMHIKRGGGAWAFGGVADIQGALHVYGDVVAGTSQNLVSLLDLGGVKILRGRMDANGGTAVFTFSGTCAFCIFTGGADATIRSTIYGYCTGAGAVSETKTPSGASGISFTNATNKLTVKNTSQYTAFYAAIIFGYPENIT